MGSRSSQRRAMTAKPPHAARALSRACSRCSSARAMHALEIPRHFKHPPAPAARVEVACSPPSGWLAVVIDADLLPGLHALSRAGR